MGLHTGPGHQWSAPARRRRPLPGLRLPDQHPPPRPHPRPPVERAPCGRRPGGRIRPQPRGPPTGSLLHRRVRSSTAGRAPVRPHRRKRPHAAGRGTPRRPRRPPPTRLLHRRERQHPRRRPPVPGTAQRPRAPPPERPPADHCHPTQLHLVCHPPRHPRRIRTRHARPAGRSHRPNRRRCTAHAGHPQQPGDLGPRRPPQRSAGTVRRPDRGPHPPARTRTPPHPAQPPGLGARARRHTARARTEVVRPLHTAEGVLEADNRHLRYARTLLEQLS
ncbi:hypothetical protein SCHAM137S_01995 [Streptomyces chartreusis]